jgi:hypothetical protein
VTKPERISLSQGQFFDLDGHFEKKWRGPDNMTKPEKISNIQQLISGTILPIHTFSKRPMPGP